MIGGGRKTLEGESPLLKEGALSLQTSLSHRELPPRAPACTWQRFVSLCTVRVLSGEVFVAWGGTDLLQSAAVAPDWWGGKRYARRAERYAGCSLRIASLQSAERIKQHRPKTWYCRERPACRSVFVKRYLLTHDIKTLHECRDSACRRPFGVRLRGNYRF